MLPPRGPNESPPARPDAGVVSWVRHLEMLPDEAPRAPTRTPASELSNHALRCLIDQSVRIPEKRGVISSLARRALGVAPGPTPDRHIVLEAHVDAVGVDVALASRLSAVGFELDEFERFEPAHFTNHFTLKLVVDRADRRRFSELRRWLRRASRAAFALLQDASGVRGYVEEEVYSDHTIFAQAFRPPTDEALADFPLRAGALRAQAVPTTVAEAAASGVGLHVTKQADLHVKTPGEARVGPLSEPERLRVARLRRMFIQAGLYEVATGGGNLVYTGQFRYLSEARQTYCRLADYLRVAGGATQICLETCTALYRTSVVDAGGVRHAELPPLVQLQPLPDRPTQR